LRLRWNSQPTVQKTSASGLPIRFDTYRLRIHLPIELRKQFDLIVADLCGILAQITGAKDTTRELLPAGECGQERAAQPCRAFSRA
jgi:hypothetical protein